ncbi:MAG: hypothetical protein GVY26_11530 [Bacteroidetes bacterium]|jgi:hypothetical protein|nr:hypothetical protein [Bacteroidota bacterium]
MNIRLWLLFIAPLLILGCGGSAEHKIAGQGPDLIPKPSSTLLRIDQNGRNVAKLEAHSPYYQQVMRRQKAIAFSQLDKVKPNASMAFKVPTNLSKAAADDVASLVSSAMKRPNRNTLLGLMAGAGLITAVYVLDEEEEEEKIQWLQSNTKAGVERLSTPRLLSDDELQQTISRYVQPSAKNIEKVQLDFKALPSSDKVHQALTLVPKAPKVSNVQIGEGESVLSGLITKNASPMKGVKVQMEFDIPPLAEVKVLYAYFYDEQGQPLQGSGIYKDPATDGARVSSVFFPLETARNFDAGNPLTLVLPYSGVEVIKPGKRYLCRIYWASSSGEMQELNAHYFSI